MNFEQIKALDQEHIMHTYKRFDVCFDHGKGATIWDVNQKEYVDFSSGIGVNSLGFCDPDWLKAVEGQMERYTHMSNLFYSQINAETADLLCQKTGYDQVFFANSGAEAN